MFEWDETVVFNEEAQYVRRSCRQEDPNQALVEKVGQHRRDYQILFPTSTTAKLGPRRIFDHSNDLKPGAKPPLGPIYTMSAYQLDKLDKYLKDMVKQGKIIHRQSTGGARILIVPNRDGKLRLCVDYRNLNKMTMLNTYPLQLMADIKDRVAGTTIFTKLDLKD